MLDTTNCSCDTMIRESLTWTEKLGVVDVVANEQSSFLGTAALYSRTHRSLNSSQSSCIHPVARIYRDLHRHTILQTVLLYYLLNDLATASAPRR